MPSVPPKRKRAGYLACSFAFLLSHFKMRPVLKPRPVPAPSDFGSRPVKTDSAPATGVAGALVNGWLSLPGYSTSTRRVATPALLLTRSR